MTNTSKSSVSGWVKNVQLTPEQIEFLLSRNPAYKNQCHGGAVRKNKAKLVRLEYQEAGRLKALENDPLHLAGCMLYWGEGAKSRNDCKMSNSDLNMLKFFKRFLLEACNVQEEKIKIAINCYTNNGLSIDDIESYWSKTLDIPRSQFTKTVTNNISSYSQQKKSKNKLLYGTVSMSVHSVQLVQSIYGAIQHYANFRTDFCID